MQALLVLVAGFFLALMSNRLLFTYAEISISLFIFSLLNGIFSAVLAWMIKLSWWWRYIVAFFPIAATFMMQLQLPPSLFLGIFIFLALLYWTTFKSQVPFYPSNIKIWREVEKLFSDYDVKRMIDIGSGLGGAALYWSQQHSLMRVDGVEVAPLPWLISVVRAKLTASQARFLRQDYMTLNFADYDVVFAYLSPAAMDNLWDKARQEMRSGTLLVSYEFIVEGHKPSIIMPVEGSEKRIYAWIM